MQICKFVILSDKCNLLTYLLTPWYRVLLEKLTGLQLVKKFPVFHGTRRFITALTSVRHLSLSWASPIQCIYPHPTSWRSILLLSTHLSLGLPSDLLHSPVTSSLLGPNILLNTMFSNTLSFLSSRNVNDQVSHPYKTTGKIIIRCILVFKFLDSNLGDKRFCTE